MPADEWFRRLAETTSAAILVHRGSRCLYGNRAAAELFGHSVAELTAAENLWELLVTPEDRPKATIHGEARLRGEPVADCYELRLLRPGGEVRWADVTTTVVEFDGEPAVLDTLVDVTQERLAREALGRQVAVEKKVLEALYREKELAQVTLASIGDGVIRTDASGRIDYLNPVAEQLTGWQLEEAIGREVPEVYQVLGEASRRPRRNPVEVCLAERRNIALPGLFLLHSRGGDEYTIRDSVSPILDRGGEVVGTVLVFRDLTRMRGLERENAYLASHDPLTGLLNRTEFEIYLEAAFESARDHGAEHALLYLNLVQFKLVNDTLGHVAGDELLRRVGSLLRGMLGEEAILGRLGGDDFAVLLENHDPTAARRVAGELQRRFRDELRFTWGGQLLEVDVSLGLVPVTAASDSAVQVLQAADAACYLAREQGRNRVHEFLPDDTAMAERSGRLQWVHRIRRSLAEDRLCLYHQRIQPVDGSGRPMLYEILVRMIDENGKLVPPGVFIPIAESYDLAPSLDRWVVRRTLKLLAQDDRPPLAGHPVSINLSGQSLSDERFLDYVIEHLAASRVPTERIFFEITETAAVANLSRALNFINTLRAMGCRFILDDFGSGLSSFAYLKNLPVDLLKIDGEFISSMEKDPIRRAMVESINQIGQVMGLGTIAECVETRAAYDIVCDLRVDYVQGYLVHRPEPLT